MGELEDLKKEIARLNRVCDDWRERYLRKCNEVNELIKALEQEPKAVQFEKWVATEIFDEKWEYNKDAFAEIACRKLAKLGIVRAQGDEWELVESPESEDDE